MAASSFLTAPEGDRTPSAIDWDHLERMTLGDRRLEREVLELFVRQTAILLERLDGAEPGIAAAAAHTLNGSARGIGAWRVAHAAEWLERAAGEGAGDRAVDDAVAELKAASLEVGALIGAHLTGPSNERARAG